MSDEQLIGPNPCWKCGGEYGEHAEDCSELAAPTLLERLNKITTLDGVDDARMSELMPHVHIIIGDGGRCMCGIYEGQALTCQTILGRKSHDIQAALIQAETCRANGGKVLRSNASGEPRPPGQKP